MLSETSLTSIDTSNDAILYYNVGKYGKLGYGVPNWANKAFTLNSTIRDLCDMWGKALSDLMHTDDAMLTRPPSQNVVRDIHRAYQRSAMILANNSVGEDELFNDAGHSSPTPIPFKVYPVPCFNVYNKWMRRWDFTILRGISHMMQHTENRRQGQFSKQFAEEIGDWLSIVYKDMAMDLFLVPKEIASQPGFLLTADHFKNYKPSDHVLKSERSDVTAPLQSALTEDSRSIIYQGIYVTQLPKLSGYPTDPTIGVALQNTDVDGGTTSSTQTTTAASTMPAMPTSTNSI